MNISCKPEENLEVNTKRLGGKMLNPVHHKNNNCKLNGVRAMIR